ncbi:Multidrug resistance-associated protein 9 [Heterocephalus glaber]|uniref:Multidrug resistance-associated protein 9 n=1 Tax=Heterocephalus glaber TaxID=10181 RepID=G5C4A9_HETGA|nr:Multidrug resistance-associated protein 9 [Heterocephalus glaber]
MVGEGPYLISDLDQRGQQRSFSERYDPSLKTMISVCPYARLAPNPVDDAGLLSFATFSWLTPVMVRGYGNTLTGDTLPPMSPYDSSDINAKRFRTLWDEEVERVGPEKASLGQVAWKVQRTQVLMDIVANILCIIMAAIGPMFMAKRNSAFQRSAISVTDKRIQTMNEFLTCIKLIKMYAWEKSFTNTIQDIRKRERKLLERAGYVQSGSSVLALIVSTIAIVLTFTCHVLLRRELTASAGKVVGICGNVGSGKSSLIAALLGQMQLQKGIVAVNGTLAYVSQQAWIFHGNVRENILFGEKYNHQRYQHTVRVCGLQKGLSSLPYGDLTEASRIGERGLNLSGGQRQRISLARAVYSNCQLFLESCDEVILLEDGEICEKETHKELMEERGSYAKLIRNLQGLQFKDPEHIYNAAMVEVLKESSAQSQEDAGMGTSSLSSVSLFLLMIGSSAFSNWWLGLWLDKGSQMNCGPQGNQTLCEIGRVLEDARQHMYQWVYVASMVSMLAFGIIKGFIFTKTTLMASSSLHDRVFDKIFKSLMSFFDTTPTGRLMNRFSKDMDELDVRLPFHAENYLQQFFMVVFILVIFAVVFPAVLLVLAGLTVVFIILLCVFHQGVQELKKVENISRSPWFSHITSSMQGLGVIHAYGKKEECIHKFKMLNDENSSHLLHFNCALWWFALRMDVLMNIVTFIVALLVTLSFFSISASSKGLSLSYIIQLSGLLQVCVQTGTETQAKLTSVELLREYILACIPECIHPLKVETCPKGWPSCGEITFRDYHMRYRENTPLVLKGLNLNIQRKSSLGMALFRLAEPASGTIFIDEVDSGIIGLEDLRTKLTVIPQDPVLFVGTVRYNLDPFESHTDKSLWEVLERTFMKDTIILLDEATASMDSKMDALVQSALKDAFRGCTVQTIAHRLNTVLNCDRVLVMESGKVIEFDKPEVLAENPDSAFAMLLAAEVGL